MLPKGRVFKELLALNGSDLGLRKPRLVERQNGAERRGLGRAIESRVGSCGMGGLSRPQIACGLWAGTLPEGGVDVQTQGPFRMVWDQLPHYRKQVHTI